MIRSRTVQGVVLLLVIATTARLALGTLLAPATAVLIVVGTVLVWAVVLLWNSVRVLTGELPVDVPHDEDPYEGELEEQKEAAFAALRDLQTERDLGRITDRDFAELSSRYRQEAKAIMRKIDEELEVFTKKAEVLVEKRLTKASSAPSKMVDLSGGEAGEPPAEATVVRAGLAEEQAAKERANRVECFYCGASNELDASFCKSCGKSVSGEPVQ